MMELLESSVVYDGLPISSGGAHGLGRITARNALNAWTTFLDACTQTSAIECWFQLPPTLGLDVEPAVRRALDEQFPIRDGKYAVARDRFNDALALYESLQPQPANRYGMGPVWLWFNADFQVRSPTSSELWPGQDPTRFGQFRTPAGVLLGTSSARLMLHAKRSMGLVLSLPMATDSDLAVVLPWLQSALPMRLSVKHWTRWTWTKDRRSYRPRKIAPPPAP
jgi:hypothetical protein